MDRYVIKGRGKNRGKYLCYAWAAGLKPGGDTVWLPEQSKAMRHDHPKNRHGGWGYVEELARKHNGYFVKLTAKKSVIARVDELEGYIASRASGAKERPNCYWLDGDWSGDEGPNYCWECASKKVDVAFAKDPNKFKRAYGEQGDKPINYHRYAIDGGWSMDHDSTPDCEVCGVPLDGILTDHGANEEIRALDARRPPRVGNADDWYDLSLAVMNLHHDDPRWNKIARVVDAAMAQERKRACGERR